MSGRDGSIADVTQIGDVSFMVTAQYGAAANTLTCHRSDLEGTNPYSALLWKHSEFIEGEPKRCQVYGKLCDDITKYCKGLSMWDSHRFPIVLIESANGKKITCKKLDSRDGLQNEFDIVLDRIYVASINGQIISFKHYFLIPKGQYKENEIDATRHGNLVVYGCCEEFESAGGLHELIGFDDFEKAVGPMCAGQYALEMFVQDHENSMSDCYDAFILYGWLGSLEATIDELVDLSPWASEFILGALKKYGPILTEDSNYLMSYGDAVDSLQYQLDRFCAVTDSGRQHNK